MFVGKKLCYSNVLVEATGGTGELHIQHIVMCPFKTLKQFIETGLTARAKHVMSVLIAASCFIAFLAISFFYFFVDDVYAFAYFAYR